MRIQKKKHKKKKYWHQTGLQLLALYTCSCDLMEEPLAGDGTQTVLVPVINCVIKATDEIQIQDNPHGKNQYKHTGFNISFDIGFEYM